MSAESVSMDIDAPSSPRTSMAPPRQSSTLQAAANKTSYYTSEEQKAIIAQAVIFRDPLIASPRSPAEPDFNQTRVTRIKTILENLTAHQATVSSNLCHELTTGPIPARFHSHPQLDAASKARRAAANESILHSLISTPWDGKSDVSKPQARSSAQEIHADDIIPPPAAVARMLATEELLASYDKHAREARQYYEKALDRATSRPSSSASNRPTPTGTTASSAKPPWSPVSAATSTGQQDRTFSPVANPPDPPMSAGPTMSSDARPWGEHQAPRKTSEPTPVTKKRQSPPRQLKPPASATATLAARSGRPARQERGRETATRTPRFAEPHWPSGRDGASDYPRRQVDAGARWADERNRGVADNYRPRSEQERRPSSSEERRPREYHQRRPSEEERGMGSTDYSRDPRRR